MTQLHRVQIRESSAAWDGCLEKRNAVASPGASRAGMLFKAHAYVAAASDESGHQGTLKQTRAGVPRVLFPP